MKFRTLTVVWSLLCGIMGLLSIALWMRSSYWKADILVGHVLGTQVRIDSGIGFLAIHVSQKTLKPMWVVILADDFRGNSGHTYATGFPTAWAPKVSRIWGRFESSYQHHGVCVPYWFVTISFALLAVAPWVRRQFSVRALLIITTLIAAMLGVIVYIARKEL